MGGGLGSPQPAIGIVILRAKGNFTTAESPVNWQVSLYYAMVLLGAVGLDRGAQWCNYSWMEDWGPE